MKAFVVWLTGRSGSGKSTIADRVIPVLEREGKRVCLLDGDSIRKNLHGHLGFSREDIKENSRRIVELCGAKAAANDYVFVTVISPFAESREHARRTFQPGFAEIYVNASAEECARRDVKGLYELASKGLIPYVAGASPAVPYEPPASPDLEICTEDMAIDESAAALLWFLAAMPSSGP